MKKRLPNLYKGRISKNSNNQNRSIINSTVDNSSEKKSEIKNVNNQIRDIFSSANFVYKADVTITTTTGDILKKTIIGRTNNSLITMDDELIDVSKISQIDFN